MALRPFLTIDENLSLHLARHELAEAVFMAVDANRGHLRQWLPWVDGTRSVEDTKGFICQSMAHNSSGSKLITFILLDGQVVGSVGMISCRRESKSCEIGYWLVEGLQGRGIMSRACACLIGHLFKTKDLNRVEIKTVSHNLRSQAVPVRLGFTLEGTLRQGLFYYDEYHDLHLYSMLKNEWRWESA